MWDFWHLSAGKMLSLSCDIREQNGEASGEEDTIEELIGNTEEIVCSRNRYAFGPFSRKQKLANFSFWD